MAKYADTEEGFKQFLEDFSKREPPPEESPHAFHPQISVVTEHEVQGEILYYAALSLEPADCPDILKFKIAREAANEIVAAGIHRFADEDEEDIVYSTTAIAYAATRKAYDVCVKWHKEPPKFEISKQNAYSVYGIKNTRRKMEDKHSVITDLNTLLGLEDVPPTQYYAVFDGHGGLDASVYTSKHLHVNLAKQESFKTDLQDALKKTILELDNAYSKKSERDGFKSGTTAVACVIRENVLYISWIGDSQGVLVRDGREFSLMDPHKPDRPDEKKRIEDLGGCVIWFGAWRVNGTLSVSRAIGDPEFKPFVCGDADTSKVELTDDDDYLCIACDGFWDVFNGTQLAQMVSQHMKETGDKSSLAKVLCNKAKEAGSSDNITVLIVFLKDVISEFKEDETKDEEKVKNAEAEDENTEPKIDEQNKDDSSADNITSEDINTSKPDGPTDDSVMVQGSKLQPSVKERPPHRLYVNKPQSISSKVNVLVTDTTPHARLPHSVVTHRSPWQKSPIMERRDTKGRLLSLSTVESEEVTMPLTFGAENRLRVSGLHTLSGFPTITHRQKQNPSPMRCTPSPSVMSEPVMSGRTPIAVHYPSKPVAQKDSTTRRLYKTSIVMNQCFPDDVSDIGGFGYQRPKLLRRASRSVPDRLNKLSHMRQQGRWSESQSQNRLDTTAIRSFARQPRNGYHKENVIPHGMPYYSYFDTDIAITNSLQNKIKPKRSIQKRKSFGSMGQSSQPPVFLPLRQVKN